MGIQAIDSRKTVYLFLDISPSLRLRFKLKKYYDPAETIKYSLGSGFGRNLHHLYYWKLKKEEKQMKKTVSKISKILFVLTMIFSMSFAQISNIEAWDNTVPHEFTKVKKIKYPEWWGNKVPGLSSWSTYSTKYNGKWAYCLESSKKTPGNGNYAADVIENNEAVRKLMYYGFGGPSPLSLIHI